jgi:hypothetical protein
VKLDVFKRYVPTRFLAPWFGNELRGIRDALKDAKIKALARGSQRTLVPSLYYLESSHSHEVLSMNEAWHAFLVENFAVIHSFGEHHLALYLQARNPHVPGVVNKLRAPTARQLNVAREFWQFVRDDFRRTGRATAFHDIYSERTLGDSFCIDHFLPWSFVAHDLLWNLTPVELETNSSKSDMVPDLDIYLPRLGRLHFRAITTARKRPKLLEDYIECFKQDATSLVALGETDFVEKYREVMVPQAQIAMNLGFQAGWRMRSNAIKPIEQAEAGPAISIIVPSPERKRIISLQEVIVPFWGEGDVRRNYVPYYSLEVAAGGFIAGDAPEPEGWVDLRRFGFRRRSLEGLFVSKVVGLSMEPTIADGAFCVFHSPVVGSRQNRIVLIQKRNFTDPETGGNFTVKRYQSAKTVDENGWRHAVIDLVPDNPDRQMFPVLRFTPENHEDLRVVAEFIAMLDVDGDLRTIETG